MDWIFNNFQIVALIALVVGSVLKQMVEAARTKKQERDQPEAEWEETETTWLPVPIPPEYQPPPLPRPSPPPLLQTFAPAVVVDDSGELLRKQLEMQEKALAVRQNKASEKTRMLEKQARSATRIKPPAHAVTSVRGMLMNPASARQAIVLREVLGKPVGMR